MTFFPFTVTTKLPFPGFSALTDVWPGNALAILPERLLNAPQLLQASTTMGEEEEEEEEEEEVTAAGLFLALSEGERWKGWKHSGGESSSTTRPPRCLLTP